MSRSRRKTPIFPITCAESDKWFKQSEHRRERSTVKQALNSGDDLPHPRAFGNPWNSAKDGKRFWHEGVEKWMRK